MTVLQSLALDAVFFGVCGLYVYRTIKREIERIDTAARYQTTAWDGSDEEFWAAIEKFAAGKENEGEYAVLCDVLCAAAWAIREPKLERARSE